LRPVEYASFVADPAIDLDRWSAAYRFWVNQTISARRPELEAKAKFGDAVGAASGK
jgi:hypothetical protein